VFAAFLVLALLAATDGVLAKMATPATSLDEATNWTSKAKEFYFAGGLNDELGRQVALGQRLLHARAWHPSYPNLIPLLHLWSYVNAGGVLHFDGRVPIMLFRYGLVLALAGAVLRRHRGALAGLALIPSTFYVWYVDAGADVVVACAFLVVTDCLLRFFATKDFKWWRLAMLAATCLVGAKHEGLLYAAALMPGAILHLALARSRRPRLRSGFLWLAAPASALSTTIWFNERFDVATTVTSTRSDGLSFLDRIGANFDWRLSRVATVTWDALTGIEECSRVIDLVFLALVIASPLFAFRGNVRFVTATLLLAWFGLVVVEIGTPYHFELFLSNSLTRVMSHWDPVIGLWIAALLGTTLARRSTDAEASKPPDSPVGARVRRFRVALAIVGLAAATAGPVLAMVRSRGLLEVPRRAALLARPEDARLRAHLGAAYDVYEAVHRHSPETRAVVLVVPPGMHSATLSSYIELSSLFFPRLVVPLFLNDEVLSWFLTNYHLAYANSLRGVVELTGPDVHVILDCGTEIPRGLDFEPVMVREPLVLGRGRIRLDSAESENAATRRAPSSREFAAMARRIAAEEARAAAAATRRAQTRPAAASKPTTRKPVSGGSSASGPASRPADPGPAATRKLGAPTPESRPTTRERR
jgi:hypothetical protein